MKTKGKGAEGLLGILAVLFAAVLLWSIAAVFVKQPFLPGPLASVRALAKLAASGALTRHLLASLSRICWAFLGCALPAAVLGLLAGRNKRLNMILSPVIYLVHPLPKAAFMPVIILFLGLGEVSKVFLVGFIIASQILVAARDAAERVPDEIIASVRSLGAGPGAIARHVIIPAVLPELFTSVRVSLGTAVAVLFLAETFATDTGLGYLIMDAWARIAYAEMYAAIIALSLLGLALFAATDILERICCPWKGRLR